MSHLTEQEYLEAVEDARADLISIARNYCKVKDDAEDAVQEAIIYCHKKLADYDPLKASLITWVTNIVIGRARHLNYYRDRDMVTEAVFDDIPEDESVRRAQKKPRWKAEVDEDIYEPKYDLVLDVQKVLGQLPAEEQDAVRAVMMEGHTEQEYADSVGVSRRTVSRQLARAKETLREKLKDYRA